MEPASIVFYLFMLIIYSFNLTYIIKRINLYTFCEIEVKNKKRVPFYMLGIRFTRVSLGIKANDISKQHYPFAIVGESLRFQGFVERARKRKRREWF